MTAVDLGTLRVPSDRAVAARPHGLPRLYLATWALLACVSVAYLGHSAIRSLGAPQAAADRPQTTGAVEKLTAEVDGLRRGLADYQADLGVLRAELERNAHDPAAIASLAAIEERMAIITGRPVAPRAASVIAPVAAASVAAPVATLPTAPIAPIAATAPLKPAMPLETGSLAGTPKPTSPAVKAVASPVPALEDIAPPAVIAFGPAKVKPEPKPFAVQLSSAPSLDALRLNWALLSDQHGATLGKLQPRFQAGGTDQAGPTFDLLAGPIKTAADARKVCKALAARGTDCRVAPYEGEGL